MKLTMHIDANSFGRKFNKMLDSPLFKESAQDIMEATVENAKDRLMSDFNSHPVTKEIEAGPLSSNTTDLLDGYGNLYSFIGFDVGEENPIIALREELEKIGEVKPTRRIGNRWYFSIASLSSRELERITPMPFEDGSSWADGIENGISNLSHYMYKHWEPGRSQEAFQLPYENNEDLSFKTTEYLTPILENFREGVIE